MSQLFFIYFSLCFQKSCHYQGNQGHLPVTLWLLNSSEYCSMHQSLIQEIISASAIRNMSSGEEKKPSGCSALRLKDITLRTLLWWIPSWKSTNKYGRKKSHILWHRCSRTCSVHKNLKAFYFISFPEKRSYSYWVMHFILYLKITDKHWNVCRHLHNMLNTVLYTAMSFVIWTTPFYFYTLLPFNFIKLLWNCSIYFLKLIQFSVMGVLDLITVFIGKEAGSPGQVTNLSQGNHPYLWPI